MFRVLAATAILLFGLSANLSAELIETPSGKKEAYSIKLPGRSMSKQSVRKEFGKPAEISAEVGSPPISKWRYDNFTVYFEDRYVIHAIVN